MKLLATVKLLAIIAISLTLSTLAADDFPDWEYSRGKYSVNSSYPYESAVLTGPEFVEGTTILRTYVQGQIESDESFSNKLEIIVNALAKYHKNVRTK
jgi:hypothetical protein